MVFKPSAKQPLITKSLFKLNWLKLILINPVYTSPSIYKLYSCINYIVSFNKITFYRHKYIHNYLICYKKHTYFSYKPEPNLKFLNNNITSLL